jgi:hypothetical protein
MERLINEFEKLYYTPLLMFVSEFIALLLAIIFIKREKIGRAFIFYIGFDFLVLTIGMLIIVHKEFNPNFLAHFVSITNVLIAMIELLAYYYFFKQVLLSKNVKSLMNLLAVLFAIGVIIYVGIRVPNFQHRDKYMSDVIGAVEFIFLLPPAVQYYFQLLNTTSSINLFDRPSFWIVTGIFLYALVSIPYYLLQYYLRSNFKQFANPLHAAFYFIPFTLNFIFFIRAVLCKKPLTI